MFLGPLDDNKALKFTHMTAQVFTLVPEKISDKLFILCISWELGMQMTF